MRKKQLRALLVKGGILAVFLLFLSVIPASAAEGDKTIRVGFYEKENYHTINESGEHSGYDYEYLTELAKYTGWKYEFVEGTWEECLTRLENGEIDLLGSVEKTPDRLPDMLFADIPSMEMSSCLLQRAENATYNYEDFEAFDGMNVGIVAGSSIKAGFKEYSQEKDFTFTLKTYDTEKKLLEAMDKGEVDAVCLTDNRDLREYKVLAYMGYYQLYYAVSDKKPELLKELNQALEQIHSKDHYYESRLDDKYFDSPQNVAFTEAEQEYIARKEPVKTAVYLGMGTLFCRYNKEQRKYEGILVDALDLISRRTGLTFEYIGPEEEVPWEYSKKNPNVLIAPYLLNSLLNHNEGLEVLDPIVKGRMAVVSRTGEDISGKGLVLAVPAGEFGDQDKLKELFPDTEFISCETHREAIELVHGKEADMALVNEISGAYELQSPYFANLHMSNMVDITEDLTLALGDNADPVLVSILNKGIASISERDARQLVVNNTASVSYVMSRGEQLYQNRLAISLGTVICAGSVFFLRQNARRKKRERENAQRLARADERHKADLEYQKQIFRQANFDQMTKLYNQNYFLAKANEVQQENSDMTYVFLRINLRKFSMVNEIYGIATGNMVLQKFAEDLGNAANKRTVYGRLYADQFAVCLPEPDFDADAVEKSCVRFIECNGQKIRMETSIGVYIDRNHIKNAAQALDYAQLALVGGRDLKEHLCFFQDDFLENMRENQEITNNMEAALKEEEFKVYLQPQYDISTNKLVGAEALVRWYRPLHKIVSPGKFIPVFEANRFIYQLDTYMCERVCRILARWMKQGKMVPISFNLSQIDLDEPELIPMLQGMLDKYRIPPEYLHIEITESAYVDEMNDARHVVEQLRSMGFCIEMDDFGSGYSSLNMLKDIPVDILKMDMKFFDGETHMDKGGNIIEAIVGLAHSLGIQVIAEGVETEREANFLRSVNCNIVQGYLYGRPVPVKEFEASLEDCEIGEKRLAADRLGAAGDLYWKLEKYEILLRSEEVVLLDYDAYLDHGVLTLVDENGKLREEAADDYLEGMQNNSRIHPDYCALLKEKLQGEGQEEETAEYLADYYGIGKYQWFQGVFYHYIRNSSKSRTIVVIRRINKKEISARTEERIG